MPKTSSGFSYNKKGRQCCECNQFKTWKEFVTSAKSLMGKAAKCKLCMRTYMQKYYQHRNHIGAGVPNDISKPSSKATKDMNMKFLVSLGHLNKKSWTYPQVREFLKDLDRETKAGNYDFNAIYKKFVPHKTLWSCHAMRIELTKAASSDMSLKDYWDQGRPFSQVAIKNRIVTPAKK